MDVAAEYAKASQEASTAAATRATEKHEWSTGVAQKEAAVAAAVELAKASAAPFARRRDDVELEANLKAQLREGDPMAALVARKSQADYLPPEAAAAAGALAAAAEALKPAKPPKPLYSGPPPPPNRYGIRPGYRWDGVVRGNGWEAKLVAHKAKTASSAEQRYRYATADM